MKTRRNSHLHSTARVVLAIQAQPAATTADLARSVGVSRRTVIRAIRTAEQLGVLAPRGTERAVVVARDVRIAAAERGA